MEATVDAIKLGELAKFLRSKNAGPFKLTLDIIFHQRADYERVISASVLTRDVIADLYKIEDTSSVSIFEFDKASAIKITFPRVIPSGNVGEPDVYGAQQHGPLYDVVIP